MKGELRMLALAHGLLLGLILAAPLVAPGLLIWAVEALFLLSAFQLRLADRRWALRPGVQGWISHIRMAPARLLQWGAVAIVALMVTSITIAAWIVAAAIVAELLVYPACTLLVGKWPRSALAGLIVALAAVSFAMPLESVRLILAFTMGVGACLFWLRGPDGEARPAILALTGMTAAIMAAILFPASLAFAYPLGITCMALTLAQMSVVRRRPLPWQAIRVGKRFINLAS